MHKQIRQLRRWQTYLLAVIIAVMFTQTASAQYQNGIPVLLYHHVSEDTTDLARLTVTPAEFDRQMAILKQAGFETISPQAFLAYMWHEPVKLPAKPILITFDDGYEDNYTQAFPILKKYGFTAVIFMVGVNIDREQRLSRSQIREMADYGISFGGHSVTHRDLTALQGKELYHEVKDIKKRLQQIGARDTDLFSYPYGYFSLSAWETAVAAGYQAAFTVLPGLNKAGQDNVYLLRRIPVYNTTDFGALFLLLDANEPKTRLLQYSPEYSEP